ncbi:MAG: transposase [Archaeoglobales archaeon]|nr:transposase [Archaeoglobales archaeon]
MSKQSEGNCHRCGHVAQANGREFKCPKCGMEYDRSKYSPQVNEI